MCVIFINRPHINLVTMTPVTHHNVALCTRNKTAFPVSLRNLTIDNENIVQKK